MHLNPEQLPLPLPFTSRAYQIYFSANQSFCFVKLRVMVRVIFNVGYITCLSLSPQPSGPVFPPLYPPSVDSALVSNDMEHELRSLVTDHRRVKQSFQ